MYNERHAFASVDKLLIKRGNEKSEEIKLKTFFGINSLSLLSNGTLIFQLIFGVCVSNNNDSNPHNKLYLIHYFGSLFVYKAERLKQAIS